MRLSGVATDFRGEVRGVPIGVMTGVLTLDGLTGGMLQFESSPS